MTRGGQRFGIGRGNPPPLPPGRPQGAHPLVLTAPALTKTRNSSSFFVVFVRAGVAWCGVGTLAVALGLGTPPAQHANLTPIGQPIVIAPTHTRGERDDQTSPCGTMCQYAL